jgi:cytochrome bd-type quinol oxidase subunit 2
VHLAARNVRFCRAAFGTLVLASSAAQIDRMMIRKLQSGPFAERARRFAREIALAVALTFAAVVFVVAALQGSTPETASVSQPDGAIESRRN